MSSKKKGPQQREDFKQEDILQAVLIADSFNVRFAPITENKPRALLPLANTALLDYTLEFLCTAGMQQIIVFCCIHADQIKAHLRTSKWTSDTSPCEIVTIVSEDCLSVGDALRDIDAKSLIKSDFILVNGDLVSNMKLKAVLEEHKARRLREKTPIMTMVFKHALPGHPTRCREEEVILGVKADNQRILHYQKVANAKKFDFPLTMFQEHKSVQLRYDLLDCHISICSPLVPQLFTENFDYQTREHFVRGILVNEEILGNTIHLHVLEDDYAARVSNLQMYDAISKDVLNRWSHPMVPDCNVSGQKDSKYSLGRHNIYLHKDVSLARGCILHENVVIGKGSSVGQNTQIRQSVIGRNCHIGENVNLDGVYVWDNVQIENSCNVVMSVLSNDVHLLPNVTVKSRCVLADGVKIGPDITLPAGKILMASAPTDSFGDVIEGFAEICPELVGSEGVAYEYAAPPESDEEVEDLTQELWALELESNDDDMSSDDSELDDRGSLPPSPPPDDAKMFYEETISTLIRAEEENINKDNLVLEINSLKCAYYMQIHEVNAWVTRALLEYPLKVNPELPNAQYLAQFTKVIKRFLPLLKNYIRSAESQKDCISAIEEQCLLNPTITSVLAKILHILYNTDILEEDVIMRWFNTVSETEDKEERKALRKQVTPFITWLQEAEEESEEDD